jgi:hypothetical protein
MNDDFCPARLGRWLCTKRPHNIGLHVALDGDTVIWWGDLIPPNSGPASRRPGRAESPPAESQTPRDGEDNPSPDAKPARPPNPPIAGSPFTGDQCNECGSMRVIRTGTCGTCLGCGTSTGCG